MFFASGPTYKGTHWQLDNLQNALVSRSHRSTDGIKRIQLLQQLLKTTLDIPEHYHLGIINGSTTSAIECLIWNLLGTKSVQLLSWDMFAEHWLYDLHSLKLDVTAHKYQYDDPTLPARWKTPTPENMDNVFVWTSTTTGISPNNTTFLNKSDDCLNICDATATVFIDPLPWLKLDAVAFSLQKGLGSEAGLGIIVLSENAYNRLYHKPSWAVPRLWRLNNTNAENITTPNQLFFQGHTLNTISLLLVEDAISQLEHIQQISIKQFMQYAKDNMKTCQTFVEQSSSLKAMVSKEISSNSTFCLIPSHPVWQTKSVTQQWQIIKDIQSQSGFYDIIGHTAGTPCWRIWTGPLMPKDMILQCLMKLDQLAYAIS